MLTMKKSIFLVPVLLAVLAGCDGMNTAPTCKSRESCLNDPNCRCWCSQICAYRKKTAADDPVYIADDPNGKFCYCKQWDVDHYEDNCIEGKHVKEKE